MCWLQAWNDPHQQLANSGPWDKLANSGPWDKSVLVNTLSRSTTEDMQVSSVSAFCFHTTEAGLRSWAKDRRLAESKTCHSALSLTALLTPAPELCPPTGRHLKAVLSEQRWAVSVSPHQIHTLSMKTRV